MTINASITDFPVFSMQETFFKKFKEAGVDGLELVLGIKSRFEYARLNYLSEKYDLPIQSIHQPPWSGIGVYFDESFVQFGKKLGVRNIVFHPLAFHSFTCSTMKRYFKRLADLQEKYDICVMLENMPNDFAYKKLHDGGKYTIENHLKRMHSIVEQYGFMLTYDVSHGEIVDPSKNETFLSLFPDVAQIHASSFTKTHHHLPFSTGDLDIQSFLTWLVKNKYQGLFTLEVYNSQLSFIKKNRSLKGIVDSAILAKKILDKLS